MLHVASYRLGTPDPQHVTCSSLASEAGVVDLDGREPHQTETVNFLFRPKLGGETVSIDVTAFFTGVPED